MTHPVTQKDTRNGGENPVLIFHSGVNAGRRVVLDREEVILGRDQSADIVVDDRQVSRQHVRIAQHSEGYLIEDLNSKNGTWVNDMPLKGAIALKDGDVIELAKISRLMFLETDVTISIGVQPNLSVGGKLILDREARRVYVNNKEVDPPLSLPQYRLLEMLFDAKGAICTREQVIEAVWPNVIGEGVSEQAIDALIRRLRDRVTETDPEGEYVITVRGHGFRLDQG